MLAATAVVYATESLTESLRDEIAPLLVEHYSEIAHYTDIPLKPDWTRYQKIEAQGGLRIYTTRLDGKLIGYLAVFVAVNMHYSTITSAAQDVLYIDPAHRGSRAGVGMIRFAHDQLALEGVTVLTQHVKHRADINIGPVLERLGYEHMDDVWAIRLDAGYSRMPARRI